MALSPARRNGRHESRAASSSRRRSRRSCRARSGRRRPSRRSRAAPVRAAQRSTSAPGAARPAGCCCCAPRSRCPPPRRASPRTGIRPPFARIASTLLTSPAAISGVPGSRAFSSSIATSRAYEPSQSPLARGGRRRPRQQVDRERDELEPDRREHQRLAADRHVRKRAQPSAEQLPRTRATRATSTKTIRGPSGRGRGSGGSAGEPVVQRRDDERVELAAALRLELMHGRLDRDAGAVRAIRRQRVEGVRDEDQPRTERDLRAREPVRIAGAVPALVVVEHVRVDRRECEAADELVADHRVALDELLLDARSAGRPC